MFTIVSCRVVFVVIFYFTRKLGKIQLIFVYNINFCIRFWLILINLNEGNIMYATLALLFLHHNVEPSKENITKEHCAYTSKFKVKVIWKLPIQSS